MTRKTTTLLMMIALLQIGCSVMLYSAIINNRTKGTEIQHRQESIYSEIHAVKVEMERRTQDRFTGTEGREQSKRITALENAK